MIDSYLRKKLLINIMIVVASLSTLILLMQILRLLFLVINKGFPIYQLFLISLSTIHNFIVEAIPFALLAGTLFTWNQLYHKQELIIMQACGIKPYSISKHIIFIGLLLSLIIIIFAMYISPKSYLFYLNTKNKMYNSFNIKLIEPNKFIKISDSIMLFTTSKNGNKLNEIMIYNKDYPQGPITIFANSGYIDIMDDMVVILLDQVNIYELNLNHQSKNFIYLDKYLFKFELYNLQEATNTFDAKALSLWNLINYKNLPNMLDIMNNNNQEMYSHLEKDYLGERNKKITHIIYTLLLSIVVAYNFNAIKFSRMLNLKPIFKSIAIALTIKIINIYALSLDANTPYIIYLNLLYIIMGCLLILRIIYPPNLNTLNKYKYYF